MAGSTTSRVKSKALRGLQRAANKAGYRIESIANPPFPLDFGPEELALCARVKPHTLTGPERIIALRDAVRYVIEAGIEGSIVECGVWRGGSMLVIALTLLEAGVTDRDLYLFDTFTEMPDPTDEDVDIWGRKMEPLMDQAKANPDLQNTPVDAVRQVILSSGYPAERVHMVQGMVEDTVPAGAPDTIALLRLDTDWYESTKHEMEHLWPRVPAGGVLIVDDYGQFVGCKKAVDEYLAASGEHVLLQRIDFTGRLVIRPGD